MNYVAAWANRHDGECELDGSASLPLDCRCYVRWLEGRLGEMETVLGKILKAEATLVCSYCRTMKHGRFMCSHCWTRLEPALFEGLALLPPKGAD